MEDITSKIELENDRVRVIRVKTQGRGPDEPRTRHDRLIIYLQDGHIVRTEDGQQEEVRRKAGDVVWRPASQHQIEHVGDGEHEVLVVELK